MECQQLLNPLGVKERNGFKTSIRLTRFRISSIVVLTCSFSFPAITLLGSAVVHAQVTKKANLGLVKARKCWRQLQPCKHWSWSKSEVVVGKEKETSGWRLGVKYDHLRSANKVGLSWHYRSKARSRKAEMVLSIPFRSFHLSSSPSEKKGKPEMNFFLMKAWVYSFPVGYDGIPCPFFAHIALDIYNSL